MKDEFDKWLVNFDDGSFDSTEMAAYGWRFGWQAARDKILQILKDNERIGEEQYGKNCIEYKYYLKGEIFELIEKL